MFGRSGKGDAKPEFFPAKRDITLADKMILLERLNFADMAAPENMALMAPFSAESRERFAYDTKSMVYYLPDEVVLIRSLEEAAAMRAAPQSAELKELNGLNIGCGDRKINEYLMPVDIMREAAGSAETGQHHAFLSNALLANPEDLPFKAESIDFIVALHMLEHVSNPSDILLYWGTLLKPGGGIGLILPDFEYTWDAKGDFSAFGHKWNSSASNFRKLFDRDLSDVFVVEKLGTLPFRISFDVVLRKPGNFSPFLISNATSQSSGAELSRLGAMVSDQL